MADGNVDLITDPINGNQDFSYDTLDRLTTATGPYGTGGATTTFTYTYNQIGNMLSNPQVGTYTYPTSGAGVVRPHAATVVGPYPLTYDHNGNLLTLTDPSGFFGYSGTYNVDNRLSSLITTYAGVPTTSTFVYDGDGGRVKKIDGTTTTRYISKLYECDTTGTTTSCSRFIWAGDTRVATVAVTSGTVHYWHGDHLGSSSVITDNTGAKVQALTYYPYGDIRTNQSFTTPAVNVPYKFTGKELDFSSNLYFYEARYYHAVFGRFIAPDTIVPDLYDPQSLNRYSYARNNPLIYTDPTGHFFKSFFKGITKLFQNPIIRAVSWAVLPGAAVYIDPTTRGPAVIGSAAAVGFVIGGPIGGQLAGKSAAGLAFWGATGGAVSGGITGAYQDGTIDGALKGVFSGAMFGAIGGVYQNSWDFSRVILNSAAGGLSSQVKGKGFLRGFATSLAVSGLSFAAIEMRQAMIASSMKNADNFMGASVGFNKDGIKLGGGRVFDGVSPTDMIPSPLGGVQGGPGMIFGVPYDPGSIADRVVEAYAGPHDFLNSGFWYNGAGNAINHQGIMSIYGEALNYTNALIATPFVGASVTPNMAYQYFAR